ncbi:MAG: HPr family phosphocarrier protein [Lachnospiraceae bacterium]|nr:HPr family phosphocarrier protein [Lachnospiraceae bacterium]
MKERKIKMRPEEVKDFVNEASKCDFDIDIFYNHYIIDAKSILGVMGLDFNSTLTVKYAGYNHDFENCVNRLAIAC